MLQPLRQRLEPDTPIRVAGGRQVERLYSQLDPPVQIGPVPVGPVQVGPVQVGPVPVGPVPVHLPTLLQPPRQRIESETPVGVARRRQVERFLSHADPPVQVGPVPVSPPTLSQEH